MMRISLLACALVVFTSFAAHAEPVEIKGTFGFDVMRPEKSKCTKVDAALLKKLTKDFTCTAPEDPKASASGKPIVAECTIKKGKRSSFLLFATKPECAEERETQLANGP
jgi:hypothetical protein